MVTQDWINWLSIIVLLGFLVALVYFIVVLHRANKVVSRLDNLTGTFGGFVKEIVPAIVNMGTVVTAVQSILRTLVETKDEKKKKN
ncbi:MAG: hypothetical protein NUV80_04180 [Candidatus Berkelbacteria bacterium]|nr:hypothetical protein [Candidatus Berkelbacteria bacterium]MCR4307737.1 hypothetical protein [Candidatus Berkelbacteria bacterium]